jgi:hypothetical protein
MSDRTMVLWTIAACMLATPVAAQAPATTTTAFDGTYAGVSRTLQGYQADPATYPESQTPTDREGVAGGLREKTQQQAQQRDCVPNGPPGPLTIAGGVARYTTVRAGTWEGSVNAEGVLVIPGPHSERIDAEINGRGTVAGRYTGHCSYQMVWQKEGK